MNIVVDDLLVHYELTGSGRLVLLLHGWGDNMQGLADLRTELTKNCQVLAVDLPGFGTSQAPAADWGLDNYAGFLQAVLSKLELTELYAVIGHSNGGALAIRAISMQLLEPQKLILLAASGIRTGQPGKRALFKVIAKVGRVATFWLPEGKRRALRKKLYGVAGSDMLVAEHLQETFKRTVRQDVQSDAENISIPTLLIFGANDRAVPIKDGETYHRLIKQSRLEIIKDAEHFVHQDQPELVTTLIDEFIHQ